MVILLSKDLFQKKKKTANLNIKIIKIMPDFIYNPPTTPWLDIIYSDQDILVLNKPSGLLSVPGRKPEHQDSLYSRVLEQYPLAQVVHRLDMATSGLIVFALRKKAESELKRQFRERIPKKTYYAKVYGIPEQKSGTVELPLICDWPNRPKQKVCHEHGKPSTTHYEVVETYESSSLVKLTPITGRSHQLRVHMLALGHPILGDKFYAHEKAFSMSNRLLLHAETLIFLHPYSQKELLFTSDLKFQ